MSTPASSRPLRWWDLAVAVVLAGLAVIAGFEAAGGAPLWGTELPSAARFALAFAPLAGFAALYVGLGRTALRRGMADEPADAASALFLGLLLVVVLIAVAAVPILAVLQTLAYPMVWSIVERYRAAVGWSAGVALATGAGLVVAIAPRGLGGAFISAGLTAVLSFTFAVAMGTWITRIAAQGERYRALADELRTSQAEVAALSTAAGAAAERERLSRELHDTLTQTLAGLVMLAEQAERALDGGDATRGRERLGRVTAAARDAVAEARALVATTQPLGDGGLEAAIERVARRLADDTGLRVDCAVAPVAIDRERQVVLLRAAQEGLANARKHARAGHVAVRLAATPEGGAVLHVDDDGVGPAAGTPGGFGLSGLADRVRAVGGRVSFGPREGGGARLEVLLHSTDPQRSVREGQE